MKTENFLVGVVDDDEDLLALAEYSLQAAGFRTVGRLLRDFVVNPSRYPVFLLEFNPPVLVIDVPLPDRNWKFVESLLNLEESKKRGIVLTSTGTDDLIKMVGQRSDLEIVGKPFASPDSLPEAVMRRYNGLTDCGGCGLHILE